MSKANEPLRVAILGAGNWSANHIAAWRLRGDVKLTWLVRTTTERARAAAVDADIANWSDDWRDVATRDDVDAVDILLPHHLHAEAACFAMEHGKHVLLEKPLGTSVAEAKRVAEAAVTTQRVLMVAENWIFASCVQAAKAAIDRGDIGKPYMVRAWADLGHHHMYQGAAWRRDRTQMGGGVLLDGGTHIISVCRHLVGDVEAVFAELGRPASNAAVEVEDTALAMLRFSNGAGGTISWTHATQRERPYTAFIVVGDRGAVEFDTHDDLVHITRDRTRHSQKLDAPSRGFSEEINHFVDCVRAGTEPATSASRQLNTLQAVVAGYESARTGRLVRIDSA